MEKNCRGTTFEISSVIFDVNFGPGDVDKVKRCDGQKKKEKEYVYVQKPENVNIVIKQRVELISTISANKLLSHIHIFINFKCFLMRNFHFTY